jgi:plasmid stabilization system protein ParE
LEDTTPSTYKVIITANAERYFYEVVEYIYEHHTLTEAENLSTALRDAPQKLTAYPSRGAIEPRLANYRGRAYRYLVFNRTKRADIKIIYYVNEQAKEVYVTDFFPTEKDDTKIPGR